jgi:hypothetical protein
MGYGGIMSFFFYPDCIHKFAQTGAQDDANFRFGESPLLEKGTRFFDLL